MKDLNSNNIIVESYQGNSVVALSTLHRAKRKIFLSGEINQEMADNFLMTFLRYEQEEGNEPVNIFINSGGGEVRQGLMMLDVLKHTTLDVNFICTGMAASMAAVLLAAGQKGHRYVYPHSQVMIHEPLIPGGIGGNTSSIRELSESMLKTRDELNGILAEGTGKTIEEINEATKYDHYFNAEEAINFGLCDKVLNTLSV